MATLVKFRINPINDDLFAFFPQLNCGNGYKLSYSHIGQHSACSKEYEKESIPATKDQYNELKKELEEIGYILKICK